jgi:D-beta-D-heptose 7-phosphate kinase/D-beta-D-heptose 1-phosphate adenosyltransferase
LEEAKALGDKLIIGVNIDEYVKRFKGHRRPVQPLESRMRILASLECTDWIVGMEDDTPDVLIRLIKPDYLVKGGDYRSIEEVVGHKLVSGYGGEVRILQHVNGVSSTKILESYIS